MQLWWILVTWGTRMSLAKANDTTHVAVVTTEEWRAKPITRQAAEAGGISFRDGFVHLLLNCT